MSTLDTFVNKISPKLVAGILMVVVTFVGLTVSYAVLSGRSVDLWGLKIEERREPPAVTETRAATDDTCPARLASLQARVAELQERGERSIARAEILDLWPEHASKQDVIAALKSPASPECSTDDTAECLYAKILNRIGDSGGAIDLQQAPTSTIVLVQKALKGVGAYGGELDGNAAATRRSLITFQRKHRVRSNTNTIEGLVGRRTLDKIRAIRQTIVDGT